MNQGGNEQHGIPDSVNDVVYIVDRDHALTYVNQRFVDAAGTARDELLGTPFEQVAARISTDETATEELLDAVDRILRGERDDLRVELPANTPPLGDHIVETRLAPYERDGRRVGVVGVARDITARKTTERSITALHAGIRDLLTAGSREAVADQMVSIARTVIDLPHATVFLRDPDVGRLRPAAVDRASNDVLGEPPEFEPGEGIVGWAYDADEPVLLDDAQTDDRALDPPDGSSGVRAYMVHPMGDHGVFAAPAPTVGAFGRTEFEITSILAMYGRVRLDQLESKAALQRKTDRLEAFSSIVSHDLRNPLNVAQGYLEEERARRDSEALAAIGGALDRMERIIEDMLTMARQGEVIGATESVSLSELAEGCWRTVETDEATLVLESDMNLVGDASQLQQLFENLFRNAVEHGGPAVRVTVGELSDGGGFYVADDGSGIPPAVRDELFDLEVSTSADGTGLGLAIVEMVASAHGWEVTVAESADGGARFEFTGLGAGR